MFSFHSTLVLALAISTAFAAPVANDTSNTSHLAKYLTPQDNSSGGHGSKVGLSKAEAAEDGTADEGNVDGFHYLFFHESSVDATINNGPAGSFNATWKGNGFIFVGKGWEIGDSNRVIKYTGNVDLKRRASFEVQGTINSTAGIPSVWYYVTEYTHLKHNTLQSTGGQQLGTTECDGFTYNLYHDTQALTDGTSVERYYSTRSDTTFSRGGDINGTISMACHIQAWTGHGMQVGVYADQMLGIFGQPSYLSNSKGSAGSVSMTISEGSSS